MSNKILKPHQISVSPERVLIGNAELPSEAEETQVNDQFSVYSENASNQNNLDRYIEKDDLLSIEDLVEIEDAEVVEMTEEVEVTSETTTDIDSSQSAQEESEPLPQDPSVSEDVNSDEQSSASSSLDTETPVRSDSVPDAVPTAVDDETAIGSAASIPADDSVAINQQLQEALKSLADAKEQLAVLQREREQERVADLQHQEEQRKEALQRTEEERQQIVDAAQQESEEILSSARAEAEKVQQKAQDTGRQEGFAQGYEKIEPVVIRLKEVTGKIIQKRQEVLSSIEGHMVELVLLIARKVVKVLTKENRQVVVENVRHALELVRKRGEVTIRINPSDLHLSADSLKRVTDAIERDGVINFIEDSSIEEGGCVIETEFGEIDARIHSQILEIENKILTS